MTILPITKPISPPAVALMSKRVYKPARLNGGTTSAPCREDGP